MAQAPRAKSPLDTLQSMINAILIETGKALRSSNKEGGRTLANGNPRLRTFMPSATENFHQALDDLECDILRAKAVILRDYEEIKAKRIALENPEPIVEDIPVPKEEPFSPESRRESIAAGNRQPSPEATIKIEKERSRSPEKQSSVTIPDPPKESIQTVLSDSKGQVLTPPSSTNITDSKSKPIGLGIKTDGETTTSAPGTAEGQNSSIDSLFDIPDDDNNAGGDINFDGMDFLNDSSNTQNNDASHTQNTDFDLSTFGNTSQDFNMPDLDPTSDANAANKNNNTNENGNGNATGDSNTAIDDIFGDISGGPGGDNMDLDIDLGMAGAEDSVFDDMYFGGGDDGGMEHGEFDNAFFGLE